MNEVMFRGVQRKIVMRGLLMGCILFGMATHIHSALSLTGTSYTQSFDAIGDGLPLGWTVRTGATASSPGNGTTLVTAPTSWADSDGNFRNVASADGLPSGSSSSAQAASMDRAMAVRQTGTFGDPGAAFVLVIDNTVGLENFQLSLKAQMLDVEARSTTWTFDYQIGGSGDFTALGTYSDPSAWGSTDVSFNSTQLDAWNDQSGSITFRVAALSGSTGIGSRDTFGIDDFVLSYTPVPEPAEWGLYAALGCLAFGGLRSWRRQRREAPAVD